MRKSTWFAQLERALSREGMTGTEKRTVLNYYEEMYQDRRDDGAEEEAIIKEFGFPEDVAQSVREESDERSRKEQSRKDEERERSNDSFVGKTDASYAKSDDVPVGTYVNPNSDVEAQGYYRPAPQHNYTPQYNSTNAGGTPINTAPPKNNGGSSMGVASMVINILLAIVFYSVGFGLAVAGLAVIIAGFAAIAFSAGAWLIIFGIGLMLFAGGSLIFGAAIKFTKSVFNSDNGGAK